MKKFIFFTLLFFSQSAYSQWPLETTIFLNSNSAILSDWLSGDYPKLQVMLTNKDQNRRELNIALSFRIESTDILLETREGYVSPQPIILSPDFSRIATGDELAPYLAARNMNISGDKAEAFLKYGVLPDGFYTIYVKGFYHDRYVQLSQERLGGGRLVLADPPQLQTPTDGKYIGATDNYNIPFMWNKLHINQTDEKGLLDPIHYRLELWEAMPNRDVNEMVLNQKAVFTKDFLDDNTLMYNYTVSDFVTTLDTGKTYAWRVTAISQSGRQYFKNKGSSQVFSFKYVSPEDVLYTNAPENFELMRMNPTNAEFKWETNEHYDQYKLEYRALNDPKNKQFKKSRIISTLSQTGDAVADGLEIDRLYEAQVFGRNKKDTTTWSFGSKKIEFRIPVPPVFKCGETIDHKPLPPRPPLAKARKGDVFKLGGFNLYVTKITGSGGTYSGEGIVNVPFLIQILMGKIDNSNPTEALQKGFAVVYNNISVDDDYNVVTGKVDVVTKGWKSMMTEVMDNQYNASVGSVKTGAPAISGKVDFSLAGVSKAESVKEIKDSTGKVIGASIKIKDPATGKETEIKADKMPANIQDKNGKTYSVDVDGNIKSVGEPSTNFPSESEANTIAESSKASVKWDTTATSKYFLDDKTNDKIAKAFDNKYKLGILTSGTEIKYAPWKAIADGAIEPIQATVTILDPIFNKDSVIFITGKGLKYETTKLGNVYTINLAAPPAGDMQELYCRVKNVQGKWITIGKLLVEAFPKRDRTVVIVPIAGATKESIQLASLKTELNRIFNGANAYWDVQVADSMPISSLGITAITAESKLFPCYSPEMRKINSLLKSNKDIYSTNDKVSYVFVVGNNIQKPTGVDGEMPRGKQFGYIFGTPTATLLAHELGHGQYKFKHTFSEISEFKEGSSRPLNLEDYPLGSYLHKYQWDQIHFPLQDEFVCLDSDKEGQYQTDGHFSTVYLVCLMLGMQKSQALDLAKACEAPDTKIHSEKEFEINGTWLNPGDQQDIHSLTGGFHGIEEFFTAINFLYTPKNNLKRLGELLHRFGDTYAHTELSNIVPEDMSGKQYNLFWSEIINDTSKLRVVINSWKLAGGTQLKDKIEPWVTYFNYQLKENGLKFIEDENIQRKALRGVTLKKLLSDIYLTNSSDKFIMYGNNIYTGKHFFEDKGYPDMIYLRPYWYKTYVYNLCWLISRKYNLKNEIDMSVFNKMIDFAVKNKCSLKGIIDFELAKKTKKEYVYIPVYDADYSSHIGGQGDDIMSNYDKEAKEIIKLTKKYIKENEGLDITNEVEEVWKDYYTTIAKIIGYKLLLK